MNFEEVDDRIRRTVTAILDENDDQDDILEHVSLALLSRAARIITALAGPDKAAEIFVTLALEAHEIIAPTDAMVH